MKRSPLKRRVGRYKQPARKPLRKVSKKRAKRNREVKDFRQSLKQEIGRCELCLVPHNELDPHEIAGGWARQFALDKRYAILILDRSCHDFIEQNSALWSVAMQAALLKVRRPEDFDLQALNELLTRKLDSEEIEVAEQRIRGAKEFERSLAQTIRRKRA